MVLGGQPPGRVGHCQETFLFTCFPLDPCGLWDEKIHKNDNLKPPKPPELTCRPGQCGLADLAWPIWPDYAGPESALKESRPAPIFFLPALFADQRNEANMP